MLLLLLQDVTSVSFHHRRSTQILASVIHNGYKNAPVTEKFNGTNVALTVQ